jgi:hypothetical protein
LVLNATTGECVDIHIPGCLEQSANGKCQNCAKDFQLYEGICIKRINGCAKYIIAGDQYLCGECQSGYDLIHGECGSNSWKQNENSECHHPFHKSSTNGDCIIPNCQHAYEWGCYACENSYDLTKNGECVERTIPGCIDYKNQFECKLCEDSLYELKEGRCYPFGCLTLGSAVIECIACQEKNGFKLNQQGKCVIENCRIQGPEGCQICLDGRVWLNNACVKKTEVDDTACVSCPDTHFINSNNECQRKVDGCAQYSNLENKCISCVSSYVFQPSTHSCLVRLPGCVYNGNAECVSCLDNYSYNQKTYKCFIIGCE